MAAPVEPTPRPATRGAADLVAEAERLEQTAAVISDPVAKQVLLTEAALRRQEADAVARGEQPKRTREEVQRARAKERVTVDPEKDDLVTAIRKLGGIDVDLESDWAGRLSHLNKKLIGVPGIERTGEVVDRPRRLQVVGADGLLVDGDHAAVGGYGALEVALLLPRHREVVDEGRHLGALGADDPRRDLDRAG